MNPIRVIIFAATLLFAPAAALLAAPADDAIKAYRDYVTAIRGGSAEKVLKRIESVPDSSKPVLASVVESAIAVEAVKTEMTRQMGPPQLEEDGWNMGQLPDEMLKTLRGEMIGDDTVKLQVKDPSGEQYTDVGFMVLREGQWVVAAATELDLESAPAFQEPPPAERESLLKQAEVVTAAAKDVLARLKKKEFKTPVEVQSALVQAVSK